MKYDILYNFISPVTGRVLADFRYVLVGDRMGIATPSPILIDIQLDINKIRQNYNILRESDFIIGHPNDQLPNAQVLNTLEDGFIFNTEGIVSIKNVVTIDNLPNLTKNNLWIGDSNNRPVEMSTILEDNLPSLDNGKFWLGSGFGPFGNRPTQTDILPIANLTKLTSGKFWQGDSNNRPVEMDINFSPNDAKYVLNKANSNLPNAQDLSALTTIGLGAMMAKVERFTGKIEIATAGVDYVTGTAFDALEITVDALGVTVDALGVTVDALGVTVDGLVDTVFGLGLTLTALGLTVAGISLDLLSIDKDISNTNKRIDNLRLNTLPLPPDGDIDIDPLKRQIFRIINLSNPRQAQDAATKFYVDDHNVVLRGAVTGTGKLNGGIDTNLTNNIFVSETFQRFTFNDSLFSFQLDNNFLPSSSIPVVTNNFEIRNASASGFRWQQKTTLSDTFGSLALQSFVDGEELGNTILIFRELGRLDILTRVVIDDFLDMNNNNIINVKDPINSQDAATKFYVDNQVLEGIDSIILNGFVLGGSSIGGLITTTRGPTCLLTNIPAGGDVDMESFRVKNLAQSPVEDFDAVSTTFLWDLIHDRVDIIWS